MQELEPRELSPEALATVAHERAPEMAAIVRAVSGLPHIDVTIGELDGGSFANVRAGAVTLDPRHLGDSIEEARFVSGHEAMHIRITPHPYDVPRDKAEIDGLYRSIGFAYAQNVVEDIAVNTCLKASYDTQREYAGQVFADPEEKMASITPEVLQLMAVAGMQELPKFAQFGTALSRQWSHGNPGKFGNEDPAIAAAVQAVWPVVESMLQREVPDRNSPKQLASLLGTRRWELITDSIWPVFQQFIDEDLQSLQEQFQNGGQLSDEEAGQQAEQLLESIEDLLNKQLNPAAQPDSPATTSHTEHRQAEATEQAQQHVDDAAKEAQAARQAQLDANRLASLEPAEALIDDIADMPQQLARRLMRVLGRTEFEAVTYGMPSGQTIDMRAAMQYEANPYAIQPNIFGRFIEPTKRDYRIGVLADCSRSMEGEEFTQTMRALAVLARTASFVEAGNNQDNVVKFALGQFGVQVEDTSTVSILRSFHKPNYPATQRALGELLAAELGSTPMTEATKLIATELRKDPGASGNIVLYLSDGDPDDKETQKTAMQELRRNVAGVLAILVRIEPDITQVEVDTIAHKLGFDAGLALPATSATGSDSFTNKLSGTIEKLLA